MTASGPAASAPAASAPAAAGVWRRLLGHTRPFAHFFALSIVGFAVYAASQVGFTELLGMTVDTVRASGDGEDVSRARILIPLGMVLAVSARGLGGFVGQYFLARVSHSVVHRLRMLLFDRLLTLPAAFFDQSSQGHLVSRITYTVAQVTGAATKAAEVLVREGLTVLALVGWMLWMNWRLATIFLLIAPLIALVVALASRRFRRIAQRIQTAMGEVTHLAAETVVGHREVRIFGGEAYERRRFGAASALNMRQAMKMAATGAISTPVIQVLVASALALLVWLILDPVMLAGMSGGDVVGFITAAGLLAKPIRQLTQINAVIQRGLAAAEDVFEQLDEAPERDQGTLAPERVAGHLSFRDVSFAYSAAGPKVLEALMFEVPAGATVALVGRSGSGKSTLVSLIPRFHAPSAGQILLDGEDLADYALGPLRRQIALVNQDVVLFNDTVARNIAYGGLADADPAAVREAARRAHALEFIDALPDGMETRIGDDGVLLSGGQRQRLAIARALLKDAPVLILDEATSALDSESEAHIQAALTEVMAGRTTLVIAHRLSTVERADEILVLDAGRVVERGDHAALLALGGVYAGLHARQFGGAAVDASTPASDPEPSVELAAANSTTMEQRLVQAWYSDSRFGELMAPLGAVTGWIARWRRDREGRDIRAWHAPVPVIVVGNITVGGTGKTPFVIWLAQWLVARGWRPGIVSRGHGGEGSAWPIRVDDDADAAEVGDEPVLIRRRTGLPVVVDPDRAAAAAALCEAGPGDAAQREVDLILSDDGLQHLALGRDLELALVDGARGFGNGRCLPAGPLREDPSRLDTVDLLIANGPLRAPENERAHERFDLVATRLLRLCDGEALDPADARVSRRIHGVAGIAHPQRFFDTLGDLGYEVIPHPFDDHHRFTSADLEFGDDLPIIVTEKDAVRLTASQCGPRLYALRVEVVATQSLEKALTRRIAALAAARTLEVR